MGVAITLKSTLRCGGKETLEPHRKAREGQGGEQRHGEKPGNH